MGEKLEITPGTEFRIAYEEAVKYGASVTLGDRPIQVCWIPLLRNCQITINDEFVVFVYFLGRRFSFVDTARILHWFNFGKSVQVTLKRTWGMMSTWHKIKLLFGVLTASFDLPSADEFQALVNFLTSFWCVSR